MSAAFIDFDFTSLTTIQTAQNASYIYTSKLIQSHAATLSLDYPDTPPELLPEVSIELLRSLHESDPSAAETPLTFSKPSPPVPSRVQFVLYADKCPKTVENFLRLCDGTKGLGKASKKPLHYKGGRVHRIVEGYCVQWGDIVKGDGSSGDSIYGGKFNDEPQGLKLPITRGSLVMANSGKHSNTSQVFIVLSRDAERIKKNMQGKHVVFGHVIGFGEGDDVTSESAIEAANVMALFDNAKECTEVLIKDCGVY
ncbi:hypothetical protein HDU79_006781 [Rhizoclosmatium sp. JEL0117]|nr:hypothetical protein HDU79_006781 [Rhizoclosmatium sp. JEL0117]